MDPPGRSSRNDALTTALVALILASIAALTYRDILGYFFTGEDTLILIDSNRIKSAADLRKVLALPLMAGSTADEAPQFYRPTSNLSYSLDYFVWKLDPFGYHLTDLLLHAATSVLVFFFMLRLALGSRVTAGLGALIFATHPALFNIVPVPGRRQDILATLFLLLSLLTCLKYHTGIPRKKRYLAFSICACLLALGAKEIAVILPVLVFFFLLATQLSHAKPWKKTLLSALRGSLPYVMTTFIFLLLRMCILAGVGSYGGRSFRALGPFETLRFIVGMVINYFTDLLYPLGFLGAVFSHSPGVFTKIVSVCLVMAALVALFAHRASIVQARSQDKGKLVQAPKILMVGLVTISAAYILAYPLMPPRSADLLRNRISATDLPCSFVPWLDRIPFPLSITLKEPEM